MAKKKFTDKEDENQTQSVLPLYAAGAGLNFVGDIVGIRSQRAKAKRLAEKLRQETLVPLDARLATRKVGLSESAAAMRDSSVGSALQDLAQKGVLQSSFAAPQVYRAAAPFEAQRQRELDELSLRRGAAAAEIASVEESAPGYGEAFAGLFGQAGQLFAMEAGRRQAMDMYKERMNALADFYKQTGMGMEYGSSFGSLGQGGPQTEKLGVGGVKGTQFGSDSTGGRPVGGVMVGAKRYDGSSNPYRRGMEEPY